MNFFIFALGLIIGAIVVKFVDGFKSVGSLIISDPTEQDESAYIFLELNTTVDHLVRKNKVILIVDSKRFTSRR